MQKAFERQILLERIDRRDTEQVHDQREHADEGELRRRFRQEERNGEMREGRYGEIERIGHGGPPMLRCAHPPEEER